MPGFPGIRAHGVYNKEQTFIFLQEENQNNLLLGKDEGNTGNQLPGPLTRLKKLVNYFLLSLVDRGP